MLIDEKDLQIFENDELRDYFKEILQSYYSQNYRATIVLLYSFVIYDLFLKLQSMANEGDTKAKEKLKSINKMIEDEEKYSKVEKEIIKFYMDNCQLYFNRFIEDINYLQIIRNKCAHLKVNDNSLFVPNDYQARMLICSMFDNILSVKPPFIMDLFSVAQNDIERYSRIYTNLSLDEYNEPIDDSIRNSIENKYLCRMTSDSLKKTYKTFIRLLFISEDKDALKNLNGLYIFTFLITNYLINHGMTALLFDNSIGEQFQKITVTTLEVSQERIIMLSKLVLNYSTLMELLFKNEDVFKKVSEHILSNPKNLKYYRSLYPRSKETGYYYFKITDELHKTELIDDIYNSISECEDFNLFDYTKIMFQTIPIFSGFNKADKFMTFFINHLDEYNLDEIHSIIDDYNKNDQCTNRNRHEHDIKKINEYMNNK